MLQQLDSHPLQAYLTDRMQLFDIIEEVIGQIGPVSLVITTFSTSEEFLRHIYRLRRSGLIRHATMVADLKASNHSKVALMSSGDGHRVAIVTSQNQTRGNRHEAGVVTTDRVVFGALQTAVDSLIKNSYKIDGDR